MILKNEGATVYRALNSVKDIVDNYVIGIDKSTSDNTREEVERFGAHYYEFKWEDDFSKARNDSFERCSEWVFMLDGHEYVENGQKILTVSGFDVYLLEIWNYANGNVTAFEQPRFFKNTYKMFNKCHNVLLYDNAAKIMDVKVHHKRPKSLMIERQVQRAIMNMDDLLKRINDGDRRAEAQIIQEYMSQRNWCKAVQVINGYLKKEMLDREKYQVLIKLSMCYFFQREYEKAKTSLLKAGEVNEDKRNAHYVFLSVLSEKMSENGLGYAIRALSFKRPEQFFFLYPDFYYKVPKRIITRLSNDKHRSQVTGTSPDKPNINVQYAV